MFWADIFGQIVEVAVGNATSFAHVFDDLGIVDPRGDGGLDKVDVFLFPIGVIAQIGVAGFDEDDGLEAYFAKDGGEENACVYTISLAGVIDLIKEPNMLYVGVRGGVGGACYGRVCEAL